MKDPPATQTYRPDRLRSSRSRQGKLGHIAWPGNPPGSTQTARIDPQIARDPSDIISSSDVARERKVVVTRLVFWGLRPIPPDLV